MWRDRDRAEIERSAGVNSDLLNVNPKEADAYVDSGVRQFTLGVGGPDFDLAAVPQWLAWRDRTNERLGR